MRDLKLILCLVAVVFAGMGFIAFAPPEQSASIRESSFYKMYLASWADRLPTYVGRPAFTAKSDSAPQLAAAVTDKLGSKGNSKRSSPAAFEKEETAHNVPAGTFKRFPQQPSALPPSPGHGPHRGKGFVIHARSHAARAIASTEQEVIVNAPALANDETLASPSKIPPKLIPARHSRNPAEYVAPPKGISRKPAAVVNAFSKSVSHALDRAMNSSLESGDCDRSTRILQKVSEHYPSSLAAQRWSQSWTERMGATECANNP